MIKIYILFNGLLYCALAVWCVLFPDTTARFLGLTPTTVAGQSEFLAVYGGLQGGLGLFYCHAFIKKTYEHAALIMSCYIYAGLVLLRSVTIITEGFSAVGNAQFLFLLECTLAILAFVALKYSHKQKAI